MAQAMQVLTLPDWRGAGPSHWLSRWEAAHGYQRLHQHDWERPLRGDWVAQLEGAVADAPTPIVLVAHGLGCVLVAWWAAHSRQAHKARAALLVAPPDLAHPELAVRLHGWRPVLRQPLPFAAQVLASSNDPYCSLPQAQTLATAWQAGFENLGALGHINAESGLGDWPQGHARLQALV